MGHEVKESRTIVGTASNMTNNTPPRRKTHQDHEQTHFQSI
jgi:hypothetical protein